MNRETESHFSNLPTLEIKRSSFKRPHDHKTTWNASDLIPIYVDSDILPGDSVKMDMASLVRMQTPIFPVMDNAYMDIFFFFVPHRLVWDHWREFWGENRLTAWEQQTEYTIPQIEAPEGGWNVGTIADYMGIPTGIDGISVNHLPFRAYVKCWNDWFRDENLKDPAMMTADETTLTGTNTGDYVTNAELGAKPLKVAKFNDYFTSALPSPQKGPSVNLPLGSTAPIIGADPGYTTLAQNVWENGIGKEISLYRNQGSADVNVRAKNSPTSGTPMDENYAIGLATDLSNAIGATINQLRQAFAVQAFYEAQARGGSRYIEFIKNIFGVTSPDGRMQRAEYLGGTRIQINIDQVLQTSGTTEASPQGNTAAFSCTVSSDELFTHSFTEHGTLLGLACIRTDHTYQQGLNRMWSRKKWTDYFIPQFANLGELPILNEQIYAQGTDDDKEVFGYQEAWADYKYMPNRISGEMRSTYAQSLDAWHYGDDYSELPTLSGGWIDETEANVDRTISVQHQNANQFFGDFYFDATYVRPMPVYSIPAMLNHF
jgi:hypothetical protein